MIFLEEPRFADPVPCPYIDGEEFRQEYFVAYDLNEKEWDNFLQAGWRRFGLFFFRPACKNCQKCLPLRIDCMNFTPSKSQRRVIRKNRDTVVTLSPPIYSEELYDLYKKHSIVKFEKVTKREEFKSSFFQSAVPAAMSLYYVEEKLVGVGFIDISSTALSSVYFVYDPDYSDLALGTFSVIKEVQIARELGLLYYNLGYWIESNKSMSYKGNFFPRETYDWDETMWKRNPKSGLY